MRVLRMTKKAKSREEPKGPLSPAEIVSALGMAGHSLELDLARMFRAGGMTALVGPWVQIPGDQLGAPPDSVELDLMTSIEHEIESSVRKVIGRCGVAAFVEAKRLHA